MKRIKLKQGRDASLRRRHPWVFSGAVNKVEGSPEAGETVEIYTGDGKWLARGGYSPSSQIVARVWTFKEDEQIDAEFFKSRMALALDDRSDLSADGSTTAFRLVNAESDGLPGLIVDRYGDWLVVQLLTAGTEFWREAIFSALASCYPGMPILERSDADVRLKEGLAPRAGMVTGAAPEEMVQVRESGLSFFVDIASGHKTGFYLDQRDNRAIIQNYCAGKEVLNCFSYTGGFGLFALSGGAARVTNIDSSADALDLSVRNFSLNGFETGSYINETADVFHALRKYRDQARQFDLIVLDPPKFVGSASQMDGGTRGYKDINLLAFKLIRPGGMLFTFSCSGLVGPELFSKIIADAAADARREVQVVRHLYQATDHPVSIYFPEGLYLKGLACRVH